MNQGSERMCDSLWGNECLMINDCMYDQSVIVNWGISVTLHCMSECKCPIILCVPHSFHEESHRNITHDTEHVTIKVMLMCFWEAHHCQLRSSFLNSVPNSGSRTDRAVRSKHRAVSTARLGSGQPLSLPNTSQTKCYTSTHTASLLVIILATCVSEQAPHKEQDHSLDLKDWRAMV